MLDAILGTKIDQSQIFNEKGIRQPVTNILAGPCLVVEIKTEETEGYNSILVGLGQRRPITIKKPIIGQLKKAGLNEKPPRFLKELKITEQDDFFKSIKPGQSITVSQVFKEGDLVSITGTSKGAGFAGVVKRHHFKGGPRTHGQSDRERAPGSIGQTTTPGRVYKGKRMAGRMGNQKTTVKNLKVVRIDPEKNLLTVKGLVPGKRNSLLMIKKIKNK